MWLAVRSTVTVIDTLVFEAGSPWWDPLGGGYWYQLRLPMSVAGQDATWEEDLARAGGLGGMKPQGNTLAVWVVLVS